MRESDVLSSVEVADADALRAVIVKRMRDVAESSANALAFVEDGAV